MPVPVPVSPPPPPHFAAGGSITSLLTDAPDSAASPVGLTSSGRMLDNANVPAGTTASVTGFSIAGSSRTYIASKTPVILMDPVSGADVGTLVLAPDGAFAFTPTRAGTTLAINVYLAASDQQTAASSLLLTALPGAV